MPVKDALRLAKKMSGLTASEIGRGAGVPKGIVKRFMTKGDPYLPRLGTLPRLCSALGNTILVQWVLTNIPIKKENKEKKIRKVLRRRVRLWEEMTDLYESDTGAGASRPGAPE